MRSSVKSPFRPFRPAPVLAGILALAFVASTFTPADAADFYWEYPEALSDAEGRYPSAFAWGKGVTAVWQESRRIDAESGEIYLNAVQLEGSAKSLNARFAGPFPFRGEEPPAYSAAMSDEGELAVVAAKSERELSFMTSLDGGRRFRSESVRVAVTGVTGDISGSTAISPRVFPRSGGGWYVFVAMSVGEDFLRVYFASRDASGPWSSFVPLTQAADGLSLSLLPALASRGGRDYVVFQSRVPMGASNDLVDQLFLKYTDDRGLTWSPATPVTKNVIQPGAQPGALFNNQRPHLAGEGGRLWLAWERSAQGGSSRVWAGALTADGALDPETTGAVAPAANPSYEPRVFGLGGQAAVVWFDKSVDRERAHYAALGQALPSPITLSQAGSGNASFARAVFASGKLWAFWQSRTGDSSRVVALKPDTTVRPPALTALNFASGARTRRNTASFAWTEPRDSSGVRGYSWIATRDPRAVPPETVNPAAASLAGEATADSDGTWYIAVRAADYAGNWSDASRLEFRRDTTPPSPPVPDAPAASADGFLASNTFELSWKPADDPEETVSGYAWELRFLGPLDRLPARKRAAAAAPEAPPGEYRFDAATDYERKLLSQAGDLRPAPIQKAGTRARFANVDDGYYAFVVSAVDSVGNVGAPARVFLRADKFRPYTAVTDVRSSRDDFGKVTLTISGRGFREDGDVTRIVADRDGAEPWDAEVSLERGEYDIRSDRLIERAALPDLEKGEYRVGVYHERRGWTFTPPLLSVDESGTVKFGDYARATKTPWMAPRRARFVISTFEAFAWLAFALAGVGFLLSLRVAVGTLREANYVRLEARALLEGRPMPTEERRLAARALKRRRGGLVIKFTLTISFLVIFVVALLSVPLALNFLAAQRDTLATGLEERSRVLLEGVAAGARATTFSADLKTTLGDLASQSRAMGSEANYITVTGMESGTTDPDVVWSSNDPAIDSKIDRAPFGSETQGVAALKDALSETVPEIRKAIDERVLSELGALWSEIKTHQTNAAALVDRTDPESRAAFERENASAIAKEREFRSALDRIADGTVASLPAFDSKDIPSVPSNFLFYKPILYTVRGQDVFFRGLVRLEVNTKAIADKIAASRDTLLKLILFIALGSLAVGIAGAVVLASVIVRPINLIVKKVEEIRDTFNKERLEGFAIPARTGDELEGLAETIVDMTRGLVHGAKDNADLLAGEQDQRELLPLESGRGGRNKKLAIARLSKKDVEFFGYYKGAKLVSGDYLDYLDLDGRHYAFIKCDVSGKGVSAAMIMAVVASVFKRHFEGWNAKAKDAFDLTKFCYEVNDTLNVCDFRGKFAAFTVGILDAQTGITRLCNAGDVFYRVYEGATRRMATARMPGEAPAAGPLANFMIEMKSPFTQTERNLAPGDILVLFTDGIDEARRYWRDPSFAKVRRQAAESADGPARRSDQQPEKEYMFEDFGNDRAAAVIEAVMNKGRFELVKERNPIPDERLSFDFSSSSGTLEEVGLALVAVEKVFRMYRHPDAGPSDTVKVDTIIDAFLRDHFEQYRLYCGSQAPNPEEREESPLPAIPGIPAESAPEGSPRGEKSNPMYLLYTGVMEDEQYDDITVLLMRRK